jgi:hypothetical protein
MTENRRPQTVTDGRQKALTKAISDAIDEYRNKLRGGFRPEFVDYARAALERAIADHVAEQVRAATIQTAAPDSLPSPETRSPSGRMCGSREHRAPLSIDDVPPELRHLGLPTASVLMRCEGCGEIRVECVCARVLAAHNTELKRKLDECRDALGATSPAIADVVRERAKQRAKWGVQHDKQHVNGEMVRAAKDLLGAVLGTGYGNFWGLASKHDDERDRCVIAAALVIAHIDRLDYECSKEVVS